MLQMMLVLQSRVQNFHARRKGLSRVEVQVGESDFVRVLGGGHVLEVEVDSVVVAQIYQQLRQTSVLQDGRQVLVGLGEFRHQLGTELSTSYGVEIADVHEGNATPQEDLFVGHQSNGVFEGHLDEILSQDLVTRFRSKSNLSTELLPNLIVVVE